MHDILNELIEEIFNSWSGYHTPFPNPLFHYTSSEGLIGIVSSKCFWMTELRYMNDLSELQYARDLVKKKLELVLLTSTDINNYQKSFLERIISVDPFIGGSNVYSTSFCEHGNLLGQWRAYRGRGGGYAVGIDFFRTLQFLDKPCILRKVIYDRKEQELLIDSIIDKFLTSILKDTFESVTDDKLVNYSRGFDIVLSEYIPSFKHPDFSEEREWRLIYKVQDALSRDETTFPRFRSYEGNIIPYHLANFDIAIKASKDDTMGIPFPIVQLNIGPTVNGDLNRTSARHLLRTLSLDFEPHIVKSEIPLRWL